MQPVYLVSGRFAFHWSRHACIIAEILAKGSLELVGTCVVPLLLNDVDKLVALPSRAMTT